MIYKSHWDLKGKHAVLSGSNSAWLNYSDEHLVKWYENLKAKEKGTVLHEFASVAIKERIKQAPHKKTINMFINDAIGFRMESELILFYSYNCFGTADALSFHDNILRIFDLKTGAIEAKFRQLEIYAALFCLEYDVDPFEITTMDLRIYQSNQVKLYSPEPDIIKEIMLKIKSSDIILDELKSKEG